MKRKIRLMLCVMILLLAAAGCQKQSSADDKATWSDLYKNSSNAEQNEDTKNNEDTTNSQDTQNKESTKGEEGNQEASEGNESKDSSILTLNNQLTKLSNGVVIDADSDGKGEEIQYQIGKDLNSFTLNVGKASVTVKGENFFDALLGICLIPDDPSPFFLMTENGPSDDYKVYVYKYQDNALEYVGYLGGLPMDYQSDGIFSATVRAKTLQTWFYDAQYYIATHYDEKEDKTESYVAYLPKEMYKVGTVVTALQDIPTYISRSLDTSEYVIKAGDKIIITGSDDVEFLYIQSIDQEQTGYVRMKDGYQIQVEDGYIDAGSAFDGLFMAD